MTTRDEASMDLATTVIFHIRNRLIENCGKFLSAALIDEILRNVSDDVWPLIAPVKPFAPQSTPESAEVPSVLLCPKCGCSEVHHIAGNPDGITFACQSCGEVFGKSRPAGVKPKTPIADAIREQSNELNAELAREKTDIAATAVDCDLLISFMLNLADRIQAVESQS